GGTVGSFCPSSPIGCASESGTSSCEVSSPLAANSLIVCCNVWQSSLAVSPITGVSLIPVCSRASPTGTVSIGCGWSAVPVDSLPVPMVLFPGTFTAAPGSTVTGRSADGLSAASSSAAGSLDSGGRRVAAQAPVTIGPADSEVCDTPGERDKHIAAAAAVSPAPRRIMLVRMLQAPTVPLYV